MVEEGGDQGGTRQRRPVPAHIGLIPGENANIFQQGVNVTLITECPFESVREKQPPLHTSPTRRGDDSGQIE